MTDNGSRGPLLELDKLTLTFGGLKALTERRPRRCSSARSSA